MAGLEKEPKLKAFKEIPQKIEAYPGWRYKTFALIKGCGLPRSSAKAYLATINKWSLEEMKASGDADFTDGIRTLDDKAFTNIIESMTSDAMASRVHTLERMVPEKPDASAEPDMAGLHWRHCVWRGPFAGRKRRRRYPVRTGAARSVRGTQEARE